MVRNIIITLILCCSLMSLNGQRLSDRLQIKTLNGATLSLDTITKDTTVVLMFWASWCKPCINELEALKELHEQWRGKLKLVAISIDDARAVAKVRSIVKGKNWPFSVFLDPNQELYKALNLTSIPCSLIVQNGKVIWKHYGYMPGSEQELLKQAFEAQYSKYQ